MEGREPRSGPQLLWRCGRRPFCLTESTVRWGLGVDPRCAVRASGRGANLVSCILHLPVRHGCGQAFRRRVRTGKCMCPRYLPPGCATPLVWRPQPRGAGYGTDESGAAVRGSCRVEQAIEHPGPMFPSEVEHATRGVARATARMSGRGRGSWGAEGARPAG